MHHLQISPYGEEKEHHKNYALAPLFLVAKKSSFTGIAYSINQITRSLFM
jgi:hypothetical protein